MPCAASLARAQVALSAAEARATASPAYRGLDEILQRLSPVIQADQGSAVALYPRLRGLWAVLAAAILGVLVGNDIHRDLPSENPEMMRFLEQLAILHRLLAKQADEVVEVVAGIAMRGK